MKIIRSLNKLANLEVKNSMKVIFILVFSVLSMLLIPMAAPVFAVAPTRGTFTQGIVQINVNPGVSFITNRILHARDGNSVSYLYGAPWGNSISGTGVLVSLVLDTTNGFGNNVAQVVDTYAAGTVKGTTHSDSIGRGSFIYQGPTFTFTLNGRTGTVTNGATYIGGLFSGFAVKHGVSGDLKGLETMETYTGVNVIAGPLAGVIIIDNVVAYKLPG